MTDVTQIESSTIARRLTGGAALSLVRLIAVAIAGLLGTVILARVLGPETWGIYSAVWSCALLTGAVLTHGVRDRLAGSGGGSDGLAASSTWTVATWTAVGIVLVQLALSITWFSSGFSLPALDGHLALVLAASLWLASYPLRLPAMVGALRRVRPVRVMTLESIDAVVLPAVAVLLLRLEGTMPLAVGMFVTTALGLVLAFAWGRPLRRAGVPRVAVRIWFGARELSMYQLAAVGRELVIPAVLLATAGAVVAGAYGLALPLGAMVSLALAVAAQPAFGALAALDGDDGRSARLTNTVRHLLGSFVSVLVPFIWLAVPPLVAVLFGSEWEYATSTIVIVMTAYAVNAAIVPWVNVLVLRPGRHRGLLVAQLLATTFTVLAACAGATLGATGVATMFLVSQLAFGCAVGVLASREVVGVRVAGQSAYVAAAALGVAIVALGPSELSFLGVAIPLAAIFLGPSRTGAMDAWRAVRQSVG